MTEKTKAPAPKKGDDRQDRLAERLRENLRKRKEQARAREKADKDEQETM
ncbi:hypothetical protein [Azospirillum sp.]|nr:hypothetical protein [Azospirillum sp.]HYD64430.1 hypothetical protein [Azospirillum sp.]